jgi:quercetin dioxygenase-like cupin family protein
MDTKHINATHNRPEGERIIDASELQVDLAVYGRQIKNEDAWQKSDRNSITVFKTDSFRIVLGALREGAEMLPHKAEGTMSFQVIDGQLEINTDDLSETTSRGQIMIIHKDCNYRIVAKEETTYLLTICEVV